MTDPQDVRTKGKSQMAQMVVARLLDCCPSPCSPVDLPERDSQIERVRDGIGGATRGVARRRRIEEGGGEERGRMIESRRVCETGQAREKEEKEEKQSYEMLP